ncbi:hypothetical protein [Sphingomonas sp. 3P27F8]|jgi:hypothetical protein|uniref:hypothetical protein n=1 Tax=Sphingomonas sp. 3P27F8 TaxID=2502213 RepID=UPI0010F93E7B|nr:hypothetical protein [Sphingomonas sp. 3P27F8]
MSYHQFITVRMSGAMRAELDQLVASRRTDIGKLVRELIARELHAAPDRIGEALGQLLFVAIALDELLAAHADPNLRATVIRLWRDATSEEGRFHAA